MAGGSKSLRILLVDDEPVVLSALSRALRALSHTVLQAQDYDQAVQVLQSEAVDVVVSDNAMPGRSGVDVLRAALRMQPTARRIMCSANPPANLEELKTIGVIHRFCAKPWCQDILADMLK